MKSEDGGPAFPETRWDDKTGQEVQWCGMSLRDYFAAAALQGLLAHSERGSDGVAKEAYETAEAMLRVRNEGR